MKIAVYPGSFNPWHAGHADVLQKALAIFDKVYVVCMFNPAKDTVKGTTAMEPLFNRAPELRLDDPRVECREVSGLLKDFVDEVKATAVIKGLRHEGDLRYEIDQQYWNEDLGLKVPTVYVVSDRSLVHMSSTAMRMLKRIRE